jgi:hypothetical protein
MEVAMRRFRVPLVVLVAGVAIFALDFAVLRALARGGYLIQIDATHWLPFSTLAIGVLPMASILVIASLDQMIRMSRTGHVSRFWIGFEVFGWLAVFLFMSGCALSPAGVQRFILAAASPFQPIFDAIIARQPAEWVFNGIEYAMVTAFFLLPELIFALMGGWMMGRAKSPGGRMDRVPLSAVVSGS